MKTHHVLKPEMVMLYSWENTLEKRDLVWTCGGKKDVKNDLSQVKPSCVNVRIWVAGLSDGAG